MKDEQATSKANDGGAEHAGGVRVLLFDAKGDDRLIAADSLDIAALKPEQIAWIDVLAEDEDHIRDALEPFGLHQLPFGPLLDLRHAPLFSQQDWFGARALAPIWNGDHADCEGEPWLLLVGPNIVVTAQRKGIAFLDDVASLEDPESRIGKLGADTFAAALLDRMLTAYFDAVDAFEERLDKLEVQILKPRVASSHLDELRRLRRVVAQVRRLLSSHRDLFDALARPDFQPDQPPEVEAHFRAVSARYERAMDAVENARDLVVGSYELLTTRLSQRTNDTMRTLTFVTVLLGSLAVVAGVLGMNFEAGLFKAGTRGFWIAVGGMVGFVLLALFVGRRRDWWG